MKLEKHIAAAWRTLALLSTLFFLAETVYGQPTAPVHFEQISTDQGLSFYAVSSVLQDRQGFMWFGTLDGLNRFDGYRFTGLKHDPTDSTSLSDNYINANALYEDRAGRLWIGTRNGLNRLQPATGRIRRYKHDPRNPHSLSHDNILAVYETQAGVLWVGTEEGLNRYDAENGHFLRYVHDPDDASSLSSNAVTSILEDAAGTLWIGTRHGLNRYDAAQGRFKSYRHDPADPRSLPNDDIFALYQDRAGRLWIGTWGGGLIAFDPAKGRFTQYVWDPEDPSTLPENKVVTIREDRAGRLWIGTWGGGLAAFDPAMGRFTWYANDVNDPRSLSHNQVYAISEDRMGVLWVGTWNGLNKMSSPKKFVTYTYQPNEPHSLSHPSVSQVHEGRDGTLWIGTLGGGIDRWDRDAGLVRHYRYAPGRPGNPGAEQVTSIWEDHTGALWVSTLGGGLSKFDPATETFTGYRHDPDDPNSLSNDRLYSVYEDAQGVLWIGTVYSGLSRYDRANDRFVHYRHDAQDTSSLSYDAVWPLYEDHTETLWVGTFGGGLNAFDRSTETFTHYRHDPENPYSLSSDRVIAITEDRQGTLWIGTMGGGLNKLDREKGRFTSYTVRDGLAHNNAVCILPDEAGHLWVSTSDGLSRFDPRTEKFTNYSIADGLPSAIFYFNACYKSTRGELFFGSYNGVVAFYPDEIQGNPQPPPIVITEFELFNESARLDSSISYIQRIKLPYDQNFVAFRFAALDFTKPAQNEYAYMLHGLDNGWVHTGNRRYASYPNLAPGRYTFRVKGSNGSGIWNEEGASVHLIITPPPWRTWWAYGLYGLLLISLVGGAVVGYARWRAGTLEKMHLKEHARRLAQLDEDKSRFFANISHEFRTPLMLIIGPLKRSLAERFGPISPSMREQQEMMLRNSERLLRLINQILDLTKLEAGTVRLKARLQDLSPFVHRTVLAFSQLAELQHITLTCYTPAEPCRVYFDTELLEQVLANLLSNALKFTPEDGQVQVFVRHRAHRAEIVVQDTGIGIPADGLEHIFNRFYQVDASSTRQHEGAGIGLALAKDLVTLHGGELKAESEVGQGSTFTVSLPLGKAHLQASQIVEDDVPAQPTGSDQESIAERQRAYPEAATALSESSAPGGQATDPHGEDVTTVLVVDDNADVRAYLRSILEPTYRVLEAENGQRGLECAQAALPDLIVADVMMPEMDGFALSRALKQHPMTDCIPVVLLTARAATEDEVTGLETGADDYIIKPFEDEVLLVRLQNLIALRQRLRERFAQIAETSGDGAPAQPKPEVESSFVINVRRAIEAHLTEPAFTVNVLADEVGLSYSRMYAKLHDEFGVTPSQLIRTIRVERAAQLLKAEVSSNISEIAYAVGFNSLSYFCKCFRERFNTTPSDYAHTARRKD